MVCAPVVPQVEHTTTASRSAEPYTPPANGPYMPYQTFLLTVRSFQNNTRNISVFWLRLAMYMML